MIVALIFLIIFLIAIAVGVWDYHQYNVRLKRLAERYTFNEIDEKIKLEQDFLKSTNFRGKMLEDCLTVIDYWQQVRKFKEDLEKENYEDIVS